MLQNLRQDTRVTPPIPEEFGPIETHWTTLKIATTVGTDEQIAAARSEGIPPLFQLPSAVICSLLPNLEQLKIIEIGHQCGFTNTPPEYLMQRLTSKGATVTGIDPASTENLGSQPEIRTTRWEEMGSLERGGFAPESIDLIYVIGMTGTPWSGNQELEGHESPRQAFALQAAEQMDWVLKAGGMFLSFASEVDFRLPPEVLEDRGFFHARGAFRTHRQLGWLTDLYYKLQ